MIPKIYQDANGNYLTYKILLLNFQIRTNSENSQEHLISLGLEESLTGSLHVTDMIPIQVIRDVDLVKGKRTR